jgi:hypothetical protein
MSATDIIRIRLEPELKAAFTKRCAQKGVSASQVLRGFVQQEATQARAVDRLDALLAKASQKNASSGLSSPTIDDINAYIAKVRKDRYADMDEAN